MDTYEEVRWHALRGLNAANLAHENADWLRLSSVLVANLENNTEVADEEIRN